MKTHYILKLTTPLALSFALLLGACSNDGDTADSLAADSAFQRDLDLANRDSTPPDRHRRPGRRHHAGDQGADDRWQVNDADEDHHHSEGSDDPDQDSGR